MKIWIFFYISQEAMSSFILRRQSFPQSRERPNFSFTSINFSADSPCLCLMRLNQSLSLDWGWSTLVPAFCWKAVSLHTKPSASHTCLTHFIPKWLVWLLIAVLQFEWKNCSFPARDNYCIRFRSFYTNESKLPICGENNGQERSFDLFPLTPITISSLHAPQLGDGKQSSQAGFVPALKFPTAQTVEWQWLFGWMVFALL